MDLGTESETTGFVDSMDNLDYALKTMVAMLNCHNRAEIYIGVDSEGNILGIDANECTVSQVLDAIREKIHRQPSVNVTVEESGDGKKFVRISARGCEIPYSFNNWFYARTYRCENQNGRTVTKWNATLTCGMKRH